VYGLVWQKKKLSFNDSNPLVFKIKY